ncbi:MAG: hypothetical protein ACI8R4_001726 [Paracoccaceae bacterium]|jgi:hypothetical protein
MKRILAIVISALIPISAFAADPAQPPGDQIMRPAGDIELEEFLWTHRPIVVFADSPADPRFGEQIEQLNEDLQMLVDRDVVILTDTNPAAKSPLRLKLRPRGFMVVLIDKDGGIKLRKPSPQSVREITRTIDKTAMRQNEVEERRGK